MPTKKKPRDEITQPPSIANVPEKKKLRAGHRKGQKNIRRPSNNPQRSRSKKKKQAAPGELTEQMLPSIIREAHHLRATGYYLREVADAIAKKFGIPVPCEATIHRWFKHAQDVYLKGIAEFRQEETFKALSQIDAQLRRWLPVATCEHLEVWRTARADGETIPVLDENAYDEQLKATAMVTKLLALKADLLGLSDAKALISEDSKDRTIGDLFQFIGALAAKKVMGTDITMPAEPGKPVLELSSGFEQTYLAPEKVVEA